MLDKKEKLKEYIERLCSDEQIEFMYQLVTMHSCVSKHEILKLAGKNPEDMNYDTATPQPYMDGLKQQYPNLYNGCYIFDYTNEKIWGQLVNINDLVVKHIFETFPG